MPPLPLPAKGKGGSCPSCPPPPGSGVPANHVSTFFASALLNPPCWIWRGVELMVELQSYNYTKFIINRSLNMYIYSLENSPLEETKWNIHSSSHSRVFNTKTFVVLRKYDLILKHFAYPKHDWKFRYKQSQSDQIIRFFIDFWSLIYLLVSVWTNSSCVNYSTLVCWV